MRKLILFTFVVFIVLLSINLYIILNKGEKNYVENSDSVFAPTGDYWMEALEYSDNVVCDLKVSGVVTFENEKIKGDINVDKNSTRLTFVDINSDEPYMIGNLGDKSPLVKIDKGEVVYFLETTSFSNMNVFTLFRDKNVMTMSKQYILGAMPFGMIMMGDCVSGLN